MATSGTVRWTGVQLIAAVVLLGAACADLLRRVALGPLSGNAYLSVVALAMAGTVVLVRGRWDRRMISLIAPCILLAGLSIGLLPLGPRNAEGVYLTIALLSQPFLFATGWSLARSSQSWPAPAIRLPLSVATVAALTLGLFSLATAGFGTALQDGPQRSVWFVGARSIAHFGVISLAWFAPLAGRRRWYPSTVVLLWLIVIVGSLSRTATVVAVLLVVLVWHERSPTHRRGFARHATAVVAFLTLAVLIFQTGPFRERMSQGDRALEVGGVTVNTMGRAHVWGIIVGSAVRRPFIGHGPGASAQTLADAGLDLRHPHNDYLRLFHDFGLVGVGLFVAQLGLLWRVAGARRNASTDPQSDAIAAVQLEALVVGMALMPLTDNSIVYFYFYAPWSLMVGYCAFIVGKNSRGARA